MCRLGFHTVFACNGSNRIGPLFYFRQARWVEDGPFITSSGVSAGMDMSLGAIALMHGTEAAEEIAYLSEYSWHRDKDDDPFARF